MSTTNRNHCFTPYVRKVNWATIWYKNHGIPVYTSYLNLNKIYPLPVVLLLSHYFSEYIFRDEHILKIRIVKRGLHILQICILIFSAMRTNEERSLVRSLTRWTDCWRPSFIALFTTNIYQSGFDWTPLYVCAHRYRSSPCATFIYLSWLQTHHGEMKWIWI